PRLPLGLVAAVAAVAIVIVAVIATTGGPPARTGGPPPHHEPVVKTGDRPKGEPNVGPAGPNPAPSAVQPNTSGAVNVASSADLPERAEHPSPTLAAVDVTGASPRVNLLRCLFGPGGVGLRLHGRPNEVNVEDSGFGPHEAAVQFRDVAAEAGQTTVTVRLSRS